MATMSFRELEDSLRRDPEYVAAEKEMRPDLNLANDVIILRVGNGWSQVDLAKAVGTNQANISRLESALANPTLRFLKKLARALGAELDIRLRRLDDQPDEYTIDDFMPQLKTDAHLSQEVRATWPDEAIIVQKFAISTAVNSACK